MLKQGSLAALEMREKETNVHEAAIRQERFFQDLV